MTFRQLTKRREGRLPTLCATRSDNLADDRTTMTTLHALPPSKIINGKDLDMSTLAGKPVFIMNVASR